MNHKVLLADDSLTIQKVIKITLANQPYQITEASSEEELFRELPGLQPKLVFLDFNLSEKYTGYELTTKIKSVCPAAKVLLLLGTFDTVDEASMEKCGASDKIVKPFDSNKFIAICRQLIDTFADDEIAFPAPKAETPAPSFELEEDQWEMSAPVRAPTAAAASTDLDRTAPHMENPLLKEVSDWGISVPGVINDRGPHDKLIDIPPVIELAEVKSLSDHKAQKTEAVAKDDAVYPASDDLDYPTIEEEITSTDRLTATRTPGAPTLDAGIASKLISVESLRDEPFELEGNYVPDETDIKSLEAQIRDEVQDDFWVADELEDLRNEVETKIEQAKATYQPSRNDFDESNFKPIDDAGSISWNDAAGSPVDGRPAAEALFRAAGPAASAVDAAELRREMEAMVQKYVKDYLDQLFQKNTEKVAWEVIPDLAENLIRQELSKISNRILNEQS
jgi:DNA-binding response OmpR family regulator